MKKETQIEELAKSIHLVCKDKDCVTCELEDIEYDGYCCVDLEIANVMYNKGYRKVVELVDDICDKIYSMADEYGAGVLFWHKIKNLADNLKNKYEASEEINEHKRI